MSGWNTAFLCVTLFTAALSLPKDSPLRRSAARKLTKKEEQRLLAAIILLALWARVWRFGAVPGGINQDGAMAAVDAKALADYGTDRYGMRLPVYFTAWGYGQMSVMMSYLMAPLIRLFGLNVYTLRLPCLLCSLIGLGALYLFARNCWGRSTALWVLFFAAVDPWHVMQSRWALDCNLYPHFMMAGLWLLEKGAAGKKGCLWASMAVFGLSVYTYGIAGYTTPLFLLLACAALLRRRKVKWGEAALCAGIFLLIAWPFFAVLLINTFDLPTLSTPFFTAARFPYTVRSSDLLFFSDDIPAQLRENCRNAFRLLVRQGKDLAWNDVEGFGTLYLFSLPLLLPGGFTLWQRRRESGSALVLLLFLTGVLNTLLVRGANVNRANLVFYPMLLMVGVGIGRCAEKLRFGGAVTAAVYLCAFALFAHSYFGEWNEQIRWHFLADFGEAVTAVAETDADVYCITQDSQYATAANVSEILTLYYHEIDAGYYRGEDNTLPPYSARYRYGPSAAWPTEEQNAAYVVRKAEAPRFADDGYTVTYYGRFAVAVK